MAREKRGLTPGKLALVWSALAVVSLAIVTPAAATVVRQGPNPDPAPSGKGWGEPGPVAPADDAPAASNKMLYHGGPVMLGTVNVYYIWYGTFSSTAMTILTDFANSFGGSPYYNINTTYFNASHVAVSNSIHYGGSTNDNYSLGKSLGDASIQTIVSNAIASAALPKDTNGVYFVLTASDVNETSGFCSFYCGWHTHGTISGSDIKYSFVGNPDRCPTSCEEQTANSPNGDTGADGMANIIGHELEESTSDPDLNAWYDRNGAENADKCAWTFGPEYTAPNGSRANMNLGGRDFLIQQNWVNKKPFHCDVKYP
jgi:hypothetical protein